MRDIFGSIAKILSGTASAQALSLLLLPIISRLYSPTNYGVFGIVLAISSILAAASTLQLQQAIVIARKEYSAIAGYNFAILCSALGGAITPLITVAYLLYIGSDYQESAIYAVLAGFAVLSASRAQIIQSVAIRKRQFGRIGIASLIRVLVMSSIQIGGGLLQGDVIALLGGYILGEVSASLYLWSKCSWREPRATHRFSRGRFTVILRSYKDITVFGTAQEIMNAASQSLPVVILGSYFGTAVSGYYAFAMKLLLAPSQLVANSVRHVLSQRFAVNVDKHVMIRREFIVATGGLLTTAIIGAFVVIPFLPRAFEFLFGSKWIISGEYGKWLIIWVVFLLGNAPSTVIMRTLRKQKESFYLNTIILATRVGCLVLGGMYLSPLESIAAFSILGVAWNIIYIGMAYHYITKGKYGHGNT